MAGQLLAFSSTDMYKLAYCAIRKLVALALFKEVALVLFKLLANIFALPIALALTRMEAIFSPLASLATLAFFAVFKVLIRDFFWMDIVPPLA
jgi:hypothetical protein